MIDKGARDHAIAVRKMVARAMVEVRDALPEAVLASAERLAKDPAAPVRMHAEFFLKNLRVPDTSRHQD